MGVLKNNFSWSKSRDEVFRECQRKYYFQYYGYWGGWESGAEPRVRQIYVLKNIKSRFMWIGEVVHHLIEMALKDVRAGGSFEVKGLTQKLTERMRQEFRDSKAKKYLNNPKKFVGLYEHEYETQTPDSKWVEMHEQAMQCLTNFATVAYAEYVKDVPTSQWEIIEDKELFEVEGVPVYAKIDFAHYGEKQEFFILDWKTGKSVDVDNEVQLACYGLFAKTKYKLPTEKIWGVMYNLHHLKIDKYPMIEARLDFVKHYIRNSANGMKALLQDPETNTAREEDFPFTDNEKSCRWCHFRKVCPKFAET